MRPAYYRSTLESFIATNEKEIIGQLNLAGTSFASQWTITTTSWDSSLNIFKSAFSQLILQLPTAGLWNVLLEYEIPRLGGRIDAVLVADDLLFVIEFKLDRKTYELADIRQVEDYALDLHDFHLQSQGKTIIPILLAPLAPNIAQEPLIRSKGVVETTLKANKSDLSSIIYTSYQTLHSSQSIKIDPSIWEQSEYKPTPTIVQAARALFAGQKVEAITKYEAEAANLLATTKYLIGAINEARSNNKKIICFVTGVPGAGKTLVGLNIVHEKDAFEGHDFDTAYFSGNGPLIKVLREALARDNYNRKNQLYKNGIINDRPKKEVSEREVKSKVQNLHNFIKDGIRRQTAPAERIVIFDEAQRCWDASHFFNQSKRNQNRETNPFSLQEKSEAELLFEFMNRHEGWAVIIALVGGGQEINTGEAGIAEWGNAIQTKYSNWEVHISSQLLLGDDSTSGQTLFAELPNDVCIQTNNKLHLNVSQRSFRANNLNSWVNLVLNNKPQEAKDLAEAIQMAYPLMLSRSLNRTKEWLKSRRKGTKRTGLVASSGGIRLRPYGINVKEEINEAYWFLNDETDVRSSYYLEIAATEFAVQGLELDFVGVCWDADLRRNDERWDYKNFSGTNWQKISKEAERQYLVNKYRVLLTRAREGMIVFIPEGDPLDHTRLPQFYDPIYEYLKRCGLVEI